MWQYHFLIERRENSLSYSCSGQGFFFSLSCCLCVGIDLGKGVGVGKADTAFAFYEWAAEECNDKERRAALSVSWEPALHYPVSPWPVTSAYSSLLSALVDCLQPSALIGGYSTLKRRERGEKKKTMFQVTERTMNALHEDSWEGER